jgi:hypothetical protein
MMIDHEAGYSSQVEIRLEFESTVLNVAQVGRDSLILQEPYDRPLAGYARIVITVDGREHPHDVLLHGQDSRVVHFG